MSDNQLLPVDDDSRNNHVCPSCRISFITDRPRSMCPFCGHFFDLNAELNVALRGRSNSHLVDNFDSDDNLRLPRIRSNFLRFTNFAPFLSDSFGLIHSLMSSLLRSQDDDNNIFIQLPPVVQQNLLDSHQSTLAIFDRNRSASMDSYEPILESSSQSEPSNGTNNQCQFALKPNNSLSPHPINYPKRSLTISDLRKIIQESYENGDFAKLHNLYELIFSSFMELNSFVKEDPQVDGAKLEDPQIKMNLIYAIYDELDQLPSFISKTVLKGIILSLNSNSRLKSKDEARAVYILLQLPLFSYQSSYSVFAYLMRKFINLNSGDHQLLIHWFSRCEPERFRKMIKRILQFITIREFPPGNDQKLPSISKSRWWIPCATRVLALLNSANNRGKILPYTEFYNSALDHINLMAEYHRWQNPSKSIKFSYCQYPFILSIVAKKTILQKDSEHQMFINARKSLMDRAYYQQIPEIDVFFLHLNVRRSHLVNDSLQEIAKKKNELKKKLKVTFVGEPGLDMGGLTKEWFLLLIKQIFSEDHGMFVYHSKARCYWFSTSQNGHLKKYNLIGVLMGLAVYNSIILDLHFPKACYQKLLSPPVVPNDLTATRVGIAQFNLEHFAEVMPDVSVGLKELRVYEGVVEEDFCMNFQISVEEFGQIKTHVLRPGGEDIPVTNENREEYIQLYIDWLLNQSIYYQFEAFYLGFHSVCASNAIIMLRPEEVEMLVCGSPTIDMEELRKVTIYDNFSEDEPTIRDFWSIVKSFSGELQRQFLRFVTGSDRIPVGGMSEMVFKISAINSNKEMLPTSHTCFNQLVLPRYSDKSILRQKLVIAISNAEGFGLE